MKWILPLCQDSMKLGGHVPYLFISAKLLDNYSGGKYQPLDIMLGNHPSMEAILSILNFSFELVKPWNDPLEHSSFSISSSLKNEVGFLKHSLPFGFKLA